MKIIKEKIRDKEKTKQRLVDAVGKILKKEGFASIGINKVAEVAGVNKRMIYEYFKNLDGLITAYLKQVDFWNIEEGNLENIIEFGDLTKEKVLSILLRDFEYLSKSTEMQKIILWGISEKNKTIRKRTDDREEFGKQLFKNSDKFFEKSAVDFRAINAILVSSIYYMVLHGKTNGSTICEIDVTSSNGKKRIFDAIEQILSWCYLDGN